MQEARAKLHRLGTQMAERAHARDTLDVEHGGTFSEAHLHDPSFEQGRFAAEARAAAPDQYYPQFNLNALDTLGPNAHVGLHTLHEMTSQGHGAEPERVLIVRTTFRGLASDARAPRQGETLGALARGRQYAEQKKLSQLNADTIAYRVCGALGELELRPGGAVHNAALQLYEHTFDERRSTRALQPSMVNRFSTLTLQPATTAGGEELVYYHRHTLDTAEGMRGQWLLQQQGAHEGYLAVQVHAGAMRQDPRTGETSCTLRTDESANSYPMSYPRRFARALARGDMASAEERERLQETVRNGARLMDVTCMPAMNYADLFRDPLWMRSLAHSGAAAGMDARIFRVEAALRSAPVMDRRVSLEEVLEFHRSRDERVCVDIAHPWVVTKMSAAAALYAGSHPEFSFADLKLDHARGASYYTLHAPTVERLYNMEQELKKVAAEKQQPRS